MLDQKPSTSRLGKRDRLIFEIAPAPIWLEDWTGVAEFCAGMRNDGVTDLRRVLENETETLRRVVSMIHVVEVNERAARFVGAGDTSELIGPLPGELLNEGTLDSLIDQIMVVWNEESSLQVDVKGTDLGGADIDCQLDWAAPSSDGSVDYSRVVVLIRDVSQHRAAERAMQRNVHKLETLLDMGRGIASTFDIDIILQLLAEVAAELMDAEQSLILLLDEATETITNRVSVGPFAADLPTPKFDQVMDRLPGWVVRNRQATLSPDMSTDSRTTGMDPRVAGFFSGRPAAIAPIIVDDMVLGTLTVLKSENEAEFTEMDLSLVRMLAMQAAVAIRNADLYEELRVSRDTVQAAHEELKSAQTQLLAAQKLEAIGSLAAGIAHEINTPIQFVSDNTSFVRDTISTLMTFAKTHLELLDRMVDHPEHGDDVTAIREAWKDQDCDFLLAEVPDALEETLEGAQRVGEIVRAMKEFAHPGSQSKSSVDVNRVVETTMQVSRNEWKYQADLELDLAEDLPIIEGHAGPLGQSLLIMFVNSAQAMAEHRSESNGKGLIRVSTRQDGDMIEIRVADNGPGIPQEIIDRVFDPFFTTKDVGKGSGQGLSIARSVVVDKHDGEIWIENGNPGAVFVIRLPISSPASSSSFDE